MNPSEKDVARFWAKVNKCGPDECWEWTAHKTRGGYGAFRLCGYIVRAHRVAWTVTNGAVTGGLHVLHKCDNRKCANPSHLFLGTNADNVADRDKKGRRAPPKGIANGSAKLTEEQVLAIRELRGQATQRTIAEVFGITQALVNLIQLRKAWTHV